MKKTYKMFLAFVLCMIGAMNVNAETVSLKDVPFCSWIGWDQNAVNLADAPCDWAVDKPTGMPYGDSSVNNFSDLSNCTKLVVVAKDGTPRFMFNRDVAEGQYSATEEESHLIEYPKCEADWAGKYFKKTAGENEGETVYTVDLKAIAKDKGYAHLHAIKGANWSNVTILSMTVEGYSKDAKGWKRITDNGNLSDSIYTSFVLALNANEGDGNVTYPVAKTTDENPIGVTGGGVLKVGSMANAPQTWSTQLFVKLNEAPAAGTQWRFQMDVKADSAAKVTTGSHAAPRKWVGGGIIPEFDVTTEWQTIKAEGVISEELAKAGFQSIAFDLNNNKEVADTFYFDNIVFEILKVGTDINFLDDVIALDFGFETNVGDLVKAAKKSRLVFPEGTVTVKVNGEEADVISFEGFEDGRFYIFMDEDIVEDDEVLVSFTNPTDPAYQIIYASGTMKGQAVESFVEKTAQYTDVSMPGDAYPFDKVTPMLVSANPEDGSFNLKNSIKEFKFTFDKEVNCAELVATLNGQPLTVATEGFATEVTLTREGADLPTGEYVLKLDKIYPKIKLSNKVFGNIELTLNIGKPEYDPKDVMKEMIPDYFSSVNQGGIPQGWYMVYDGTQRTSDQTYGSGACMKEYAAGGDFTRGFYTRTNNNTPDQCIVEYGNLEGYELTLEAGKKYDISYNACNWKGATYTKFELLDPEDQVIYTRVDLNTSKGTVNDQHNSSIVISGSLAVKYTFIPSTTGNYKLKWTPAADDQGNLANGMCEIVFGGARVTYIPNQAGIEWIQLLDKSMAAAKSAREANAGKRYEGEAFTALDNAITKYELEKENYTNPSAYQDAANDLDALVAAMINHKKLCDDYDAAIKKGIDVVRQNEKPNGDPNQATKFVKTELFAQLKAAVEKYHGTSEWRNMADTIADPKAEAVWQLFYSCDTLTADNELTAAIAELTEIATNASLLFTEGVSATGDSGVKVLVDRIRRGAATLKALGVNDDDELYVAANNAFTDDDDLAEAIKTRIKTILYEHMKTEGDTLFKERLDDNFNTITPEFDMSVFFKNPNTYALSFDAGFSATNTPGWNNLVGTPGLSTLWKGGTPYKKEGIAEDVAFGQYRAETRIEQTVTDLPVGVYTVILDAVEWSDEFKAPDEETPEAKEEREANQAKSFVYLKTSATAEPEPGLEEDRDKNFAATETIKHWGQYVGHHDIEFPGIVVADGKLTVGVVNSNLGQFFFDQIKAVKLTAPATGVNYTEEYNKFIESGIEPAQVAAKVRAIEVYDLNGMRTAKATRGLNIVKKYMSDGSVRIQKVIVK